ncbi:MAG TPA: nuclear transport factor 2 family protein [Acidimicrobiales bacterium]|nr:nuclear transport factor 2 family protein [Acidimicrobiales bacterium]
MSDTRAAVDALVRSYLESFATGDPTAIAAHVTEDFINEHVAALGTGCAGRAEYLRRLPGFLAGFPELRYEIEDVLVDGDRAAASYTLRARPGDRDVTVRGLMRFIVRDGHIAQRTDYWDALGYLRQVE